MPLLVSVTVPPNCSTTLNYYFTAIPLWVEMCRQKVQESRPQSLCTWLYLGTGSWQM